MKIGVDIRTLLDKQYSGVSWYTLDLLTEILKQDKINDYVLFCNSGKNLKNRLPKFDNSNCRLVFRRWPNKFFNYFLQKICRWPKLDKLSGGVDVFWSPHINFSSFSSLTKNILTIHDLSFLVFPEFFSLRKNFWHLFINVKRIIKEADVIIAISENTKNDLLKFFPETKDKIQVIYSGLNSEFKILPKDDPILIKIKKKYNLGDKIILSLGTAEPRKNSTELIRSFAEADLADWELVFVGASGWKNKSFFQAIKEAKNKDKIKILGYVNNEERLCLYNLASIFAYPSFYEGFGLPVLEAMACGCPVITSAVSSLPEITESSALLIDPGNQESLTLALKELALKNDLQKLLAKKGLEQAKKFSWEKTAQDYIKIFQNIR